MIKFFAYMSLMTMSFNSEVPFEDRPLPIYFGGHEWDVIVIDHSPDCPCGRYEKYHDDIED